MLASSVQTSCAGIKLCNGREDSFGSSSSIKALRLSPKFGLLRKENCSFMIIRPVKRNTIRCKLASSSVDEATKSALNSLIITADSHNTPGEASLILIRHGQSLWNERNLFTGCVDVPLTGKGVNEAIEAGKIISSIPIDIIYTSSLIRAQMTAMLAMTQHHSNKVPIIIHNESEQAKEWTRIFSEDTTDNRFWYGGLQGLNKEETAERYSKERVHEWRRSFDVPPPGGESLEMCSKRAVSFFREHIEPHLRSGKNVLVAAHGNSLRSIIMYVDGLTTQEVISLELSTGVPMLYVYRDGEFVNRGRLVGPPESDGLAIYNQQLDGRLT